MKRMSKRISMLAVCVLFVLTTLLGLGLFVPKTTAYGLEGAPSSVRFKQIETGADFAIALSYDNELFAWSLKADKGNTFNVPVDELTQSLGYYYPSVPTKVKFDFHELDGKTVRSDDKILKIATTQTTAAFITEKGYVYTWGYNKTDMKEGGRAVLNNLLLRPATDTSGYTTGKLHLPNIINYNNVNYGGEGTLTSILPNKEGGNSRLGGDIVGGDQNYVISVNSNEGISVEYFGWGASTFYQHANNTVSDITNSSTICGYYTTNGTDRLKATVFDMGGGTAMYINDNGVPYFKGKNFYLPSTAENIISGDKITLPKITDATAGKTSYVKIGDTVYTSETGILNSFTSASTLTGLSTTSYDAVFNDAINVDRTEKPLLPIKHKKTAMSNGFGYMIGATSGVDSKLYFYGNDTLGQSSGATAVSAGSAFKEIKLPNGFAPAQVVAGKFPLVLSSYVNDYSYREDGKNNLTSIGAQGGSTTTFDSAYTDKPQDGSYISAVLGKDGSVYAISDGLTMTKVPFDKVGVNLNVNNKIIALSSGYGNNLFALSNVGKIYTIKLTNDYKTATEKFVVSVSDSFQYTTNETEKDVIDSDIKVITKWDVKNNTIHFTKSNQRGVEETESYKQIKANIKLDSIQFAGKSGDLGSTEAYSSIKLNGADVKTANPTFSFMNGNAIADSTRILVNSTQTSNYVSSAVKFADQNLSSRIGLSNEDWAMASSLNFYWSTDWDVATNAPKSGAKQIDKKVLNYYLDFSVNYDGSELSYSIIPYQSTKERKIVMQFGVGRYDTVSNYAVNNGSALANNATFYDYKQTNLEISIGNTAANIRTDIGYFSQIHPLSNSAIVPVLDTNNPFANQYSIASMDVSLGFEKLVSEIVGSDQTKYKNALDKIISSVNDVDSGFPSSSKIDKGDLSYYNKNASTYYNNRYQYLSTDRDGNFVILSGTASNYSEVKVTDYFSLSEKNVSFSFSVKDLNKDDAYFEALVAPYTGFNNLYGLGLTYDKTNKALIISYQVIEIKALQTTDKTAYDLSTGEDKFSLIDGLKTTADQSPLHFYSNQKEMQNAPLLGDFQKGYPTGQEPLTSGASSNIPVFVQASLSLSGSLIKEMDLTKEDSEKVIPNHLKYGNSTKTLNNAKVNNFNLDSASLKVGISTNEKYSIKINQLFLDTKNIMFAEKGKTSDADYALFVNSFDKNNADVTLSKDTFTFLPKMAGKYTIKLETRRFDIKNSNSAFRIGNLDTEFIYLNLVINVDVPKLNVKTDAPLSYTVTGEGTTSIGITDRWDYDNLELVTINNVLSSDREILTVTLDENKKSFKMKGHMSGTVTIFYSVSIYGHTVSDSFPVIVQSLVEMEETVALLDMKKVYLSDLKNRLQDAYEDGSFQDFSSLVLDSSAPTDGSTIEDPNTAIYFQQKDALGEWITVPTGQKIDFLKSVEVDPDKKEFVRLELSPISANTSVLETRIVIKFRDGKDGGTARFQVAVQVEPANKNLTTKDGNNLVIGITVTSDKVNSPENNSGKFPSISGEKGSRVVDVPLEYLIGFIDKEKPDNMTIVLVTPDEGSSKYYEYAVTEAKTGIRIIPKYPTAELDSADKTQRIQLAVKDSKKGNFIVNFYITVDGIVLTLPKENYLVILVSCASGVFALLLIIFIVRMGIYWKKKAQQKKIIKKNQMLIKMRDKMHHKSEAVSREQVVRTKLKMEDPKYAKMFNTMRKDKEDETGITLDSSVVAHKAETKAAANDRSKSLKKKKGGKKSLEELKAELEAKKSAFQQMQRGEVGGEGIPMEQPMMDNASMFESPNGYSGELTRDDVENQIKAKLASDGNITFDILPNDTKNNAD